MERVVLVHGSVVGGRATWSAQRRGLQDRVDLVVLERPGFPPNPPVERVDFEEQAVVVADALGRGAHLAGHSYGGVIALLAAALRPEAVRSLALVEPPATRIALAHPAVARFARQGAAWWADGPRDDPEAFLRGFLSTVGSSFDPPSPLPAELEQGAAALVAERGPWEAEIPLDKLAGTSFPKLAVSGGHHEAFEAICDVLEERLGAERLVLPGFGHNPQQHPDFNDLYADFVARAARRA